MRNKGGGEQVEDRDDDLHAGGKADEVGLSSNRAGRRLGCPPSKEDRSEWAVLGSNQ